MCDTSSVRSLKLSTHLSAASNRICVQTVVHGFNSFTPHKPVVSKTSEADIWLSSYDPLTHVGLRGGCQQLPQRKVRALKLNKKEALSGLIQIQVPGGIQSGLTDVREQ